MKRTVEPDLVHALVGKLAGVNSGEVLSLNVNLDRLDGRGGLRSGGALFVTALFVFGFLSALISHRIGEKQ